MSVGRRIAAFGAVLLATFGIGAAIGSWVGPLDTPTHSEHEMQRGSASTDVITTDDVSGSSGLRHD